MSSLESTCNHHKTTFPSERYNTKVSATHTPTHQLDQKITVHVLRSRDINSTGSHIEIAPVDDIEGCNGKDNNSNGLENDPGMKMSTLFTYEEPESSVRYRSSCLPSEVRSYLYTTWHSVVLKTNEV